MHASGAHKATPLSRRLRLAKGLQCNVLTYQWFGRIAWLMHPHRKEQFPSQVRGQSVGARQWKGCVHGPTSGQPRSPSPVPWILMFVRSHSFETILNLVVYAISFVWCVCPSLDGNLRIWTFWLSFLAMKWSMIFVGRWVAQLTTRWPLDWANDDPGSMPHVLQLLSYSHQCLACWGSKQVNYKEEDWWTLPGFLCVNMSKFLFSV